MKIKKGFTLIELLLVIAIIGILAAIVVIAINPNKQLLDARNAQRKNDIATVLNAMYQYGIDNNGNITATEFANLPTAPTATKEICKAGGACGTTYVNLSALTLNEKYLSALPVDPTGGVGTEGTGYFVQKTANGRVTVSTQKESTSFTVTK